MISFILIVVLIGFLLWAATTYIPMDAGVKKFLVIAVIVLLVIWFLSLTGLLSAVDAPFPRLR